MSSTYCRTSGKVTAPSDVVAQKLSKDFPTPRGPLPVLQDIDLTLNPGQSLCVMGPSGSGKSTLLNILGALEPPTAGTVTLYGRNPFALAEKDVAAFRNKEVGFVFQDHCLLPQCSALENVLVPYRAGENELLLRQAGFQHVDVFFKWYNFCGLVAIK